MSANEITCRLNGNSFAVGGQKRNSALDFPSLCSIRDPYIVTDPRLEKDNHLARIRDLGQVYILDVLEEKNCVTTMFIDRFR